MNLIKANQEILSQISQVLENISKAQYEQKIPVLNNSSLGQHIRHTLEFFTCLNKSSGSGIVNYDQREHDKLIESDPQIAFTLIGTLSNYLETECIGNRPLQLEVNYNPESDEIFTMDTNLYRELAYNIEHAIHHMAILKIGLKEVAPDYTLPENFGVAVSTIKYRQSAQNK